MSTIFLFRKFNYVILLLFLLIPFQQNSFSQGLLNPTTHPKFQNPLPIPGQIDATNGGKFNMHMAQTQQWLGVVDGNGTPLMSTVWGYGLKKNAVTYPGPTFLASKNTPVYTNWYNDLPGHFLPVDPSMHMAAPHGYSISQIADWYAAGNVPTVAHLHGGHTESASDGLPEQWFTQHVKEVGHTFVKTNYVYDNSQEAATLWYHDHALGITRLNVYAGLAGFYLLEDNWERGLVKEGVLPKGKHDIEIVIQDKSFYADGQLFWPAYATDNGNTIWNPYEEFITDNEDLKPEFYDVFPLPEGGPTGLAEFFGDFIVVNGMVWPYLDVEPRPYRFRLLNGSDSRFYVLKLSEIDANGNPNGNLVPFMQIATDDGLLPNAVGIGGMDDELDALVIAPGERAEIVVDFSDYDGSSLRFLNFGPDSPFGGLPVPDEEQANPNTTGQIMQFNVNKKLVIKGGLPKATVSVGDRLRAEGDDVVVEGTGPGEPRKLALFEGLDEYGRLQPMLGAIKDPTDTELGTTIESLTWEEVLTEKPLLNDVETWEVYNFTGDAHPVHLHLVSFQILGRNEISFDEEDFGEKLQPQHGGGTGTGATIDVTKVVTGNPIPNAPNENGWKDTFIVPPGTKGIVKAKFDRLGRYVWHCHILSHEDHEMMRPFEVIAALKQGSDVIAGVTEYRLDQNYPNPFNPSTVINFSIPAENTLVSLKIYNAIGQEISTLINQVVPAGNHEVQFDATGLPSGVYFYTLTAGNFVNSKKMIVLK
jgi:spore coat protein A